MLTKEDIESLGMEVTGMGGRSVIYTKRDSDDLKRLALLGLAVVESGATAEDIVLSSWCITDPTGDERCHADYVYELRDALAAALKEGDK